LGEIGDAARATVPGLLEIALRRAPPDDSEKNLCQLCRRKLRFGNRALRKQLCGPCAVRLDALKQRPQEVPESLSELAVKALARIGPAAHEAVPALERLTRSVDPNLRWAAKDALQPIRGTGQETNKPTGQGNGRQ
jgi:hypothetical protein